MRIRPTFIFMVLLALGLASCKKDRREKPDTNLIGPWKELQLDGVTRKITFAKDGSFSLLIGYDGGGGSMLKGSYLTKRDSLKVVVREVLENVPGQPNKAVAPSSSLYEKATYSIKGDTLTLNYITYPADAPETTTAKFTRAITID
ncbi:MAG: hypothetical protein EOO85_33840 [Pedobacter sp.]|nr:MAG: hypothetical protein EOO85_33840 [Pedobacter sp.]